MMDNYQDSICLALEKASLADETVAPIHIPFLFLKAITQDFSDDQQVGSGGFGSVYKGTLHNGMVVAVKKLHNNIVVQEENFRREVDCLMKVKHKNIVRFLGYSYETQHVPKQYKGRYVWADERYMLFCFEFLSKGSLANYRTGVSSGLQWRLHYQIIKGICEGVSYLHQQRIIHMDLKPDNILLDDNMVPRIADFGISRRFSKNQSKIITENKVGSLGYMAPEFLKCGRITFKTDIYSLGVIIIEILMGCKEYPNVDEVLESWMNTFGTSRSSQLLEQVKACAEIGIDCMHDDPNRRPDIQDIIHRLNEMDIPEQAVDMIKDNNNIQYWRWIEVLFGSCNSNTNTPWSETTQQMRQSHWLTLPLSAYSMNLGIGPTLKSLVDIARAQNDSFCARASIVYRDMIHGSHTISFGNKVPSCDMLGIPKYEEAPPPPQPQHPLSPIGEACSRMDLTAIHEILVNIHYRDDEGTNELSFKEWTQEMRDMLEVRKTGDFAFRDKDFKAAIDCYTQFIVDMGTMGSPTVYARRSLCHLMCDQPEAALRDAMQAQCLHPVWPTALYMQAVALSKLNMQSDATELWNEASQLEEKWQKNTNS